MAEQTVADQIAVTVWRREPTGEPYQEEHVVPFAQNTTVLDVLEGLRATALPGLAFRHSCRSGVCGSCGVMVNGRPVLACETLAKGYRGSGLNIAPLARLEVLRDLITDVDRLLTDMRTALTWLVPSSSEVPETGSFDRRCPQLTWGHHHPALSEMPPSSSEINRQTPAQLEAYRALAECVNCLLCYAACPVFPQLGPPLPGMKADPPTAQVPDFVGPAALALARRWDLDSRDGGAEQRFAATAETETGIWACTQNGSCTLACPKGVDPKGAIGELQRAALG
ncbi:MAG: succinate dehydrogenase/fumarate reductase iron-sulfur subunit [Promicromonosporaceae bacterium]|nr:succinate dehydrogenase/fumarate reductase iron-sulfur subunit [Promicromonosporaceae bacterium]